MSAAAAVAGGCIRVLYAWGYISFSSSAFAFDHISCMRTSEEVKGRREKAVDERRMGIWLEHRSKEEGRR